MCLEVNSPFIFHQLCFFLHSVNIIDCVCLLCGVGVYIIASLPILYYGSMPFDMHKLDIPADLNLFTQASDGVSAGVSPAKSKFPNPVSSFPLKQLIRQFQVVECLVNKPRSPVSDV